MSQHKITSVQPNGSFQYTQGPMAGKTGFGFIYTFDDGSTGRCVHLTEQPKFAIGDSVEIEEAGNDPQGNRKVKLQKPGGSYGGGGGGGDSAVGAMVGNAVTNAVNLLRDGKAKPNQGEDLTACLIRLGGNICDASVALKKKYTPAPAPAQQSQPANQQQPQQATVESDGNVDDEDDVPF